MCINFKTPFYFFERFTQRYHMPWFDQDSPSLQTVLVLVIFFCRKGRKCKVLPRIGHEDPVGQLKYSFHISLTLALDSGRQSMSRSGHFTPGKETQYPPYRRLGELGDWF